MTDVVTLLEHDPGWAERYERERGRIFAALGYCTDGGVLYDIAHIGSTSVPGLAAKPCIDIMARVHPLPLPQDKVRALEDLGYEHRGEHGLPGRHYFRLGPHDVHLHVVTFDTDHWARHLLFRDYLRAEPEARSRYERLKRALAAQHPHDRAAYTSGKDELVAELGREAYRWHMRETGFGPVEGLAQELGGLEAPWFISSGWALDLFLGAPSRPHDDLDVSIWREDALSLQAHLLARGWMLHKVVAHGKYAPWEPGQALGPEVTQVHARRGEAFLDILLSPQRQGNWLFRRDETIHLPLELATMRSRGVPHLAPEIILLFKSRTSGKAPRDKDQEDFERVLPVLSQARRDWLRGTLTKVAPEHPWLARLKNKYK